MYSMTVVDSTILYVCSVMSDSLQLMDCSPPGFSVHGLLLLSGLPFTPPGDLPDPGFKPTSPVSSALAVRFFTNVSPGKPCYVV